MAATNTLFEYGYTVQITPVEATLRSQITTAGLADPDAVVIMGGPPRVEVYIGYNTGLTAGEQLTLSSVLTDNYTNSDPPDNPTPGPGLSGLACDTTVAVGDLVYFDSASTVLKRARADSTSTSPAIGYVQSKSADDLAVIAVVNMIVGPLDDDLGGALVPGTTYFLSPTVFGSITATPPSSGVAQEIGQAVSTTELLLFLDGDLLVL